MPRYFVFADDWTGALECGALFTQRGIPACVLNTSRLDQSGSPPEAEALVLSTNSRHLPPPESARIHMELMRKLGESALQFIYKKTDSTLRGNIGADLEALSHCFPAKPILYVPAYPRLGRTCRGGILRLEGRPLAETAFASDPLEPARESSVIRLLQRQTALPVVLLENRRKLAVWCGKSTGKVILACDGETESDLRGLAHEARQMEPPWLLAGPAGFLSHLLEATGYSPGPVPALPPICRSLWISGSLHPQSLEQITQADKAGIAVLEIPVSTNPEISNLKKDGFLARFKQSLVEFPHLVIRIDSAPILDSCAVTREDRFALAKGFLEELGQLAAEAIEECAPDLIGIFGGDTTAAVLSHLEDSLIYPQGQILNGIVLSYFSIASRKCTLLTKAGGFGPAKLIPWILSVDGASKEPLE